MNENKILNLIGRTKVLFEDDIKDHHDELKKIVSSSSFLVIGGWSIGQVSLKNF